MAFFCCPATAGASEWVALRPHNDAQRVCIDTGSKNLTYFEVDLRASVLVDVDGPGQLKLLTRHLPKEGRSGRRSYTLIVMCDGRRVLRENIIQPSSRDAHLCSAPAQAVGALANCRVPIPDGQHRFEIMTEEDGPVALRIFRKSHAPEIEYVSLAPEHFTELRTLVRSRSGNEYEHYGFDAAGPLVMTLSGPTELLIRTRLDLAAGTKGEAHYGIEVLRNGEPCVSETYTTRPLADGDYRGEPGILPGQSRRLDLAVPNGLWTLTIRPTAPDSCHITARILIPAADIGRRGAAN